MKPTFIEFLIEARKNPDQNTRTSVTDQLIDIRDQSDDPTNLFVSFTQINKLGINPGSSFQTPLGIYSYPIDFVIRSHQHDQIPWAGGSPFIQVFSIPTRSNIWVLSNSSQTPEIKQKLASVGAISKRLTKQDAKSVWLGQYPKFKNKGMSNSEISIKLRKDLRAVGIEGVIDNGQGIVNPNEPSMAVFFSTSVINHIATIRNSHVSTVGHQEMSPMEAYRKAKTRPFTRYKQLEARIITDPQAAVWYARDVIQGRWPEAEPIIQQANKWTKLEYEQLLQSNNIPIPWNTK
jgi:hypothetical protein